MAVDCTYDKEDIINVFSSSDFPALHSEEKEQAMEHENEEGKNTDGTQSSDQGIGNVATIKTINRVNENNDKEDEHYVDEEDNRLGQSQSQERLGEIEVVAEIHQKIVGNIVDKSSLKPVVNLGKMTTVERSMDDIFECSPDSNNA